MTREYCKEYQDWLKKWRVVVVEDREAGRYWGQLLAETEQQASAALQYAMEHEEEEISDRFLHDMARAAHRSKAEVN